MSAKKLIIIGAGIAGLSAGCYGQMNGYDTEIFEMHTKPGGLCTSWRRSGYMFDGCIHWLMGTAPRSPYYRIWSELGAMQNRHMITHDEFVRISTPDGNTFIVYTNTDRLERHMLELSPADAPVIKEFTHGLRQFSRLNLLPDKPRELMGLLDGIKFGLRNLPYMRALNQAMKTPARQFAARFQDPFLRQVFPLIFGPDTPMIAYYMFLSGMDWGDGGFPEGGSLAFAEAIEGRYRALGGQMHYGCRVEQVLLEPVTGADGQPAQRAVGIRLADGSEHRADVVISAADGRTTLYHMLDGKYLTDKLREYYRRGVIFKPVVQISLGIKRDLSHEPHNMLYVLPTPVVIAGEPRHQMAIKHYCYDPSLAPNGKSMVEVMYNSEYDYWKRLADQDRECYEAEKQQAATVVIDQLEQRYPGITGDIEVVDVSTPLTTERYTGNWQGSIEGWMVSAENTDMMMKGISKTLPGLQDFYMIGQWVEPGGGLPGVAPSGRNIIQVLCHHDSKRFTTSVPA
jgi:phytoene dehydrogenase-like protein